MVEQVEVKILRKICVTFLAGFGVAHWVQMAASVLGAINNSDTVTQSNE